jgi:DNA-binding NarL/FixJ family response regulator
MTHILFLPDDRTLLQLEAAETADELMEAVNSGRWLPPEPYRTGFGQTAAGRQPGSFFASRQGNLVVVMLTRAAAAELQPQTASLPALSPRLLEVLHGLAEGLTTRQIAVRLGVTPRMVQYHVSEIKRRLGARSRAQSVSRAQALGMVRRRK